MKKLVKVVAAIIENEEDKVLCALRSPKMSIPNRWEFPGGKVEENEDIYTALEREIYEELGCKIETSQTVFNDNIHDYETFTINLISIKCKITEGTHLKQVNILLLVWLKKENLESLKWAPADIPAVNDLVMEK